MGYRLWMWIGNRIDRSSYMRGVCASETCYKHATVTHLTPNLHHEVCPLHGSKNQYVHERHCHERITCYTQMGVLLGRHSSLHENAVSCVKQYCDIVNSSHNKRAYTLCTERKLIRTRMPLSRMHHKL